MTHLTELPEHPLSLWRLGLCLKALELYIKTDSYPCWTQLENFELKHTLLNFLSDFKKASQGPKKLLMGIAVSFDEWLDEVCFFSLDKTSQVFIWNESPLHTIVFWTSELKPVLVEYYEAQHSQ